MEMLNYDQTLELVESFMKKSGIRSYCTDICKGHCCGSCYTENQETCHKNEGRRLACSLYLCTTSVFPTKDFAKSFVKVSRGIMDAIDKIYKKVATDQRIFSSGFSTYRNKYFKVPPKELFSDFEVSKILVVGNLTPEFTSRVKRYTDMIVKYVNGLEDKMEYLGLRLSRFKFRRRNGELYVYDHYWTM